MSSVITAHPARKHGVLIQIAESNNLALTIYESALNSM